MTLEAFTSDDLDSLALRALDICSGLRSMAVKTREHQLEEVPLNAKKALDWLEKLEQWVHRADTDLEMRVIRARGARRAQEVRRKRDESR